jgi:hypothetical protein
MPAHIFPETEVTVQVIQQVGSFATPFKRDYGVIGSMGNEKTQVFQFLFVFHDFAQQFFLGIAA